MNRESRVGSGQDMESLLQGKGPTNEPSKHDGARRRLSEVEGSV
jgi:hypothetical protein